ncbi:MAG: hypothetical protein R3302_08490, partial [Sulfurimonadaceae bacterium]|nr:hypothetical protein [Sulfurimonadaceae bacterium]
LEEQGWIRIDPTSFSSGIAADDRQTIQSVVKGEQSWWRQLSEAVNLHVMYVKYVIQKWVLFYDRSRQMELLRELMRDALFVLKFVGSFALLIAVGVAVYVTLRKERCSDPVVCAMRPLLRTLAKAGIVKASGEDMKTFLQKAADTLQQDINTIDRLYHELRYGNEAGDQKLKELERLCRRFKVAK